MQIFDDPQGWLKSALDEPLALGTFIVALCGISLTVYQGILSREHNVLSVQPHFSVVYKDDSIELVNNGLGPAKIGFIQFSYNGINYKQTKAEMIDFLSVVDRSYLKNSKKYSVTFLKKGEAIGTEDSHKLVYCNPESNGFGNCVKSKFLNNLEIKIDIAYFDFYGNDFRYPSE